MVHKKLEFFKTSDLEALRNYFENWKVGIAVILKNLGVHRAGRDTFCCEMHIARDFFWKRIVILSLVNVTIISSYSNSVCWPAYAWFKYHNISIKLININKFLNCYLYLSRSWFVFGLYLETHKYINSNIATSTQLQTTNELSLFVFV